ncbi:MAG: succinylglutamate desuccinylase/aspartoacylase family protein [Balneolaceae bacterium]
MIFPEITEETKRVKAHLLGEIKGAKTGPIIIAMGGAHGNEETGVTVIQQVLEMLTPLEKEIKGRFIGIKGNISALQKKERFISEDMNRLWKASILDKIRRTPYDQLTSPDRAEIKDLLQILDPIVLSENGAEVIFIDLHTFSGEGGMFCITPRKERNIEVLSPLNIPLIFGIEQALQGTSMEYLNEAGHIGIAFETGTHGTEQAEKNALAGLLVLLTSAGLIASTEIPGFDTYYAYLMAKVENFPHKVEYVYKHIIEDGDEFVMKSDFKNFDIIRKGDLLAEDKNGEIRALVDGYLLMPLYQKQGNDGFFIIRACK